jgi:hypothetical protein
LGGREVVGRFDGGDIQGFVNCLLGGGNNCGCADINMSGSADLADIDLLSNLLIGS